VLEVGHRSSGQRPGLGLERNELHVEPRPPSRIRHLAGDTLAERGRVVGKPNRGPKLLHVDLCLEIARAEISVHQAGDVLVEPERQEQVVARDGIRQWNATRAAERGCRRGL
jgi:hypothetical protein